MNKVFYVYAAIENTLDSSAEASLILPASPYEVLDALDKLRLSEDDSIKFAVTECYRFECLEQYLPHACDLLELNALAQKLSELDSQQSTAFVGLVKMEAQKKEGPIGLSRLIDLAYSTGCCHVVESVVLDKQLGKFAAENGFIPDTENLPDQIFNLLDFEKIGREFRQRDGGVFVESGISDLGGYVVQHSDLVEAYKSLDLTVKAPDYTVLLEVSKGFFNDPDYDSDKAVQLKLPATPEALDATLDALDVWDWREVGWSCLDCRVPSLSDAVSDGEEGIGFLNHMAQRLADMEPQTMTAYKALLETANCQSLQSAEQLMDTLDQYTFSPQYSSPIEVAKGELSVTLCDSDAAQITPHLNLYQYGQALIQRGGGMLTDYGLIERKDGQPIQAGENTVQQERGGMTM